MFTPRRLIVLLALTLLTGCAVCAPGKSKLDQEMVAKTSASQ
jgi:outer membrane PBP1 activator LpoA protein